MNKHRKIAIVIMILSMVIAFWLYGMEYSTSSDPQEISETLTEYIFNDDVQVQFVQKKIIRNHMLVLFTDERYENFIGFAVFKRGLNFRWRAISANYGSSISIKAFSIDISNDNYVAICGLNIDPRVLSYECVINDSNQVIIHSNKVSDSSFIDIYENKSAYWYDFRLIDSSGSDMTTELLKKIQPYDRTVPNAGVGTAETFVIDIICSLILIIGFIIARYYWTFKPKIT
jgi:hypothetical protein